MLRIILVAVVGILVGCNTTDSGDKQTIPTGTYQEIFQGADGVGTIQLQLKADGTYSGKNYVALDNGLVNCLLSEGSGNYVFVDHHIKATNKKTRDRLDCETAMSAWEDEPDSNWEVRNITNKSFEIYLEADENLPAEWIKMTKL